jgi:hypothetical protein
VPQRGPGTQYVTLRWGETADLEPAAAIGSLCARVLLAVFWSAAARAGP